MLNGIVTAGELRVGNGIPGGYPNNSLAVNGENARVVTTGELLLGAIGRGDMGIENGGRVQAATLPLVAWAATSARCSSPDAPMRKSLRAPKWGR